MYGVAAATKLRNERWTFTLVACTQCGRSETFTTDASKLASLFSGSQIVTTNRAD
jgi:predicted nucleic-acid-binding Zn-ribbon protein